MGGGGSAAQISPGPRRREGSGYQVAAARDRAAPDAAAGLAGGARAAEELRGARRDPARGSPGALR